MYVVCSGRWRRSFRSKKLSDQKSQMKKGKAHKHWLPKQDLCAGEVLEERVSRLRVAHILLPTSKGEGLPFCVCSFGES